MPPKGSSDVKPSLPSGVDCVEKWGMTICTLPKAKEASPTYFKISAMAKYQDYRNWVVQHGESKGARCVDLRNYLICSGVVPGGDQILIPGASEVCRFPE